jgi:hypothetical protein
MRITTFLLLLIIAAYFIQGFNQPKCDHVFTQVEQANVKIGRPELTLGGGVYQEYTWPTGLQEGKELICVKCFHKQRQLLDYGPPEQTAYRWPDIASIKGCCDTVGSITGSLGRISFIKADTISLE